MLEIPIASDERTGQEQQANEGEEVESAAYADGECRAKCEQCAAKRWSNKLIRDSLNSTKRAFANSQMCFWNNCWEQCA